MPAARNPNNPIQATKERGGVGVCGWAVSVLKRRNNVAVCLCDEEVPPPDVGGMTVGRWGRRGTQGRRGVRAVAGGRCSPPLFPPPHPYGCTVIPRTKRAESQTRKGRKKRVVVLSDIVGLRTRCPVIARCRAAAMRQSYREGAFPCALSLLCGRWRHVHFRYAGGVHVFAGVQEIR